MELSLLSVSTIPFPDDGEITWSTIVLMQPNFELEKPDCTLTGERTDDRPATALSNSSKLTVWSIATKFFVDRPSFFFISSPVSEPAYGGVIVQGDVIHCTFSISFIAVC